MKIALSGISGAGKDYLAKALIEEMGFVRVSFSDQLKKIGASIFDWLESDYPPEKKEIPLNITTSQGELITLSPREIWLKLNFLREIENKLFIRKLEEELKLLVGVDIVLSDIRTKEELEWCRRNGFVTIRIIPEGKVIHKEHEFDKQLDDEEFDYEFINKFRPESKVEFLNFIKTLKK